MYKKSSKGTNPTLFGGLAQQLGDSKLKAYNEPLAWHNVFREQVTGRIDESIFSVLFDKFNGRPNAPVRVLVAMMVLKEGHGWSDLQLYEQSRFNLMVMNALGLSNLNDDVPTDSTYYDFRKKLNDYSGREGIDLLGLCFEALTRGQCELFGVNGARLRMDSKLIGSNIAKCSRLQLVIRCLQEFHKHLAEGAKARLDPQDAEFFLNVGKKSAGQVVYPLSNEEKSATLLYCGGLIMRLLERFDDSDSEKRAMLARVFEDQFSVEAEVVAIKQPKEVESTSLQSPFDEDAEYRSKGDQNVRGFSINVADAGSREDRGLQLLTVVQVEGASFADPDFLLEALEASEAVAGPVKEVSIDGAYHSHGNDLSTDLCGMEMHYTGFQGFEGRFAFEWRGTVPFVTDTRDATVYEGLEYKEGNYRITTLDDGKRTHHYFPQQAIDNYFKRKKVQEMPAEIRNRRANVEATIFQMSFLTRNGKTRYRGKFKTQMWATSRAAWINLRRIVIHMGKPCPDGMKTTEKAVLWAPMAILLWLTGPLGRVFAKIRIRLANFSENRMTSPSNYALS